MKTSLTEHALLRVMASVKKKAFFLATAISVDDNGHFHVKERSGERTFHFQYENMSSLVTFQQKASRWEMHFYGYLGHLPFTNECRDKRYRLLMILSATHLLEEKPFAFCLSPDQKIFMTASRMLPSPLRTQDILVHLTDILLRAHPYIHLMDRELSDQVP